MKLTRKEKSLRTDIDRQFVIEWLEGMSDDLADILTRNPNNEKTLVDRQKIDEVVSLLHHIP